MIKELRASDPLWWTNINNLVNSGYFTIMVVIIFPLIGILLYKLYFSKYTFDKKHINYFLIFNMFFASPIGMIFFTLASRGLTSIENIDIFKQYAIASVIIIIIGMIKYFIWYSLFKNKTNNLLIYSKKFAIQIPFLILLFFPFWKVSAVGFGYVLVPTFLVSEVIILLSIIIISIYQNIKNKNKEK